MLAALIGELYEGHLEAAVQSLREVTGAYAICVMCEKEPDTLVVARKGAPLMVGIGDGEYVVASDGSAIIATPAVRSRWMTTTSSRSRAKGSAHPPRPTSR